MVVQDLSFLIVKGNSMKKLTIEEKSMGED